MQLIFYFYFKIKKMFVVNVHTELSIAFKTQDQIAN